MQCHKIIINPEIFPINTIKSAAFVLIDRAYIILSQNKNKINIEIKPKNQKDKTDFTNEFHDLLINYSAHQYQSNRNSNIRQTIIKRVLLTNGFEE